MSRLFERLVASSVRRSLPPGLRLTEQSTRYSLCEHRRAQFFQLKPDLLVEGGPHPIVLDAKWKRIDGGLPSKRYGLDQSDFYQLFAYGHKYLEGQGDLALVFPRTASFGSSLDAFRFSPELTLRVLPFDLDTLDIMWPHEPFA